MNMTRKISFLTLWLVGFISILSCGSNDAIVVDRYDIDVVIRNDAVDKFYVALDTDMTGNELSFTATASRSYRTNGVRGGHVIRRHTVFGLMGIQLDDLKEGMEFEAWRDRDVNGYSKLSDESLLYEIARRAKMNQDQGHPWTSIEILPEFCVSVTPVFGDGKVESERLEGNAVHRTEWDGKQIGRVSQKHIRDCAPFGMYVRLR